MTTKATTTKTETTYYTKDRGTCEQCGKGTTRRTVFVIRGRVFPHTPVCEHCDTCDTCGKLTQRDLIENVHGTFVVHTCGCEEIGQDGNTFITRH